MGLGRAVKIVREKRGIGQQELAKKLRISQGFLSLVEKDAPDGRVPSFKMIKRLAAALDVPVELLLLLGCDTPKAKTYSKQIRRIASLADDILSEIRPKK